MYVCIYVCICVHVYIYLYVCMYACMYVYMYMYIMIFIQIQQQSFFFAEPPICFDGFSSFHFPVFLQQRGVFKEENMDRYSVLGRLVYTDCEYKN